MVEDAVPPHGHTHSMHRPAPIADNDEERIDVLRSLSILDTDVEEAFDRIAKQLEQSKIEEEGEAEEAPADDVASEAGSDAADPIPSRAALAAVQNLSAPTPTKKQGKKATCLHGNGPECGSCAEIFAAPPSPLN